MHNSDFDEEYLEEQLVSELQSNMTKDMTNSLKVIKENPDHTRGFSIATEAIEKDITVYVHS